MPPVIDGVDLGAMREAICRLFETIPELLVVDRYADATTTNNVPGCEVYFMGGRNSPPDEQLGYNAYIGRWRVNAFLAGPSATAKKEAQELFDVLFMRFHDTFDPLSLISAIPVITTCSFDGGDFSQHPLSDGTLYATFDFSTTFLARQPS